MFVAHHFLFWKNQMKIGHLCWGHKGSAMHPISPAVWVAPFSVYQKRFKHQIVFTWYLGTLISETWKFCSETGHRNPLMTLWFWKDTRKGDMCESMGPFKCQNDLIWNSLKLQALYSSICSVERTGFMHLAGECQKRERLSNSVLLYQNDPKIPGIVKSSAFPCAVCPVSEHTDTGENRGTMTIQLSLKKQGPALGPSAIARLCPRRSHSAKMNIR